MQPSKRYLSEFIDKLALNRGKMAFLSGPRQAGKTTLAKLLLTQRGVGTYYTWDDIEFRRIWTRSPKQLVATENTFSERPTLFIIDEIHKAKGWKGTLKGIFDTLSNPIATQILITGSARLNVYREGGDSLMGRYLHFRLHPFSLGEMLGNRADQPALAVAQCIDNSTPLEQIQKNSKLLAKLIRFGGFPEPLFEEQENLARIWRKGRVEKIVREDLRDLSRLPELSQIEMLTALLQEKAGGLLSLQSLREDLEVAHTTVRRWLNYLNQLYYCYELKPFTRSLPRSLKKEGKLYLWDWSEVENTGSRFENLVAGHLLKACHFWTDIGAGSYRLHYLRDKEKNELDFLITESGKPWLAVEAKVSDPNWSSAFEVFRKKISIPYCFQITQEHTTKRLWEDKNGKCGVLSASEFFASWP